MLTEFHLVLGLVHIELVEHHAGSNPGERVMFTAPTTLSWSPQEVLKFFAAALLLQVEMVEPPAGSKRFPNPFFLLLRR